MSAMLKVNEYTTYKYILDTECGISIPENGYEQISRSVTHSLHMYILYMAF